jgi:miniconductance mechanosensitive channel
MTFFSALTDFLSKQGLDPNLVSAVNTSLAILLIFLIWLLVSWFSRNVLATRLEKLAAKTSNTWDDAFHEACFFQRLTSVLPLVVAYLVANLLFIDSSNLFNIVNGVFLICLIFICIRILDATLEASQTIYNDKKPNSGLSIRSYLGALRISYYILAIISAIAIISGKSIMGIIGILGGLTAVFVLVFRNSLLGITANIQFASSKALQKGDWITMGDLGADGVVEDISINMLTIRNWDNTLVTIPAFKLLEHPFQNWQGMFKSGGRRIKRSLYIDMSSVQFCSEELLGHINQIDLLAPYLTKKKAEIGEANKDITSSNINGRHQTNLGLFRAYVEAYLKQNKAIHPDMTFLVRHLQPTPQGLPLQIYVFTTDTRWAHHEAIQADIFDHLLAIIPEFKLRIYQYPAGSDFCKQPGAPHDADLSGLSL